MVMKAARVVSFLGVLVAGLCLLFYATVSVAASDPPRPQMEMQKHPAPDFKHKTVGTLEQDTDRPGFDFHGSQVPDNAGPEFCASRCNSLNECKAWTYVKPGYHTVTPSGAFCWFKWSVPAAQSNQCCASGVKQ